MPAVSYVIYGLFSLIPTPGVISMQDLHTGEKIVAVIKQNRVTDDNLNR